MKPFPDISKTTFWDIDFNDLDFSKQYDFIITRIFDRGTLDEVIQIVKYYGVQKVIDTIENTERLHEPGIDLAKSIFHLKDEHFKCLEKRPSHRR
jgi:hypothetical protein